MCIRDMSYRNYPFLGGDILVDHVVCYRYLFGDLVMDAISSSRQITVNLVSSRLSAPTVRCWIRQKKYIQVALWAQLAHLRTFGCYGNLSVFYYVHVSSSS